MKINLLKDQAGKGVVELLIVVVIIGIVTTLALVGLGRSRENFTRQNIARELKVQMERARFDAIKRRVTVTSELAQITFLSETSYRIKYDLNWNGVLENVDERVIDISSRGGIKIKIDDADGEYPVSISFDENGNARVVDKDGDSVDAEFLVCDQGCTAAPSPDNANAINVSPTGTVSMRPGGVPMPNFTMPTVTNVNSNTLINPLIRVQ